MTTDRSKISGYISAALYQKLIEFKDARQLKSVSQAVTLILESHLEICQNSTESIAVDVTSKRLKYLEANYQTLTAQVEKLSLAIELITDGLPVNFCRLLTEREEMQSLLNTLKSIPVESSPE